MATQNSNLNSQGTKRTLSDDSHSNSKNRRTVEPEFTITPDNWPSFLLISSQDPSKPLSSLSPFLLSKSIKSITNEPKELKKLASGNILVQVTKHVYCEKLLHTTKLPGIDVSVRVTPHKTLNTSRGVIRASDINMCDENEILEGFKNQGVIAVQCLTRRTPEGVKRSGTYFLTFDTPDLPEHVYTGFMRIPVSPFVPNPLRCFKCQKFGHGQSRCKSTAVCAKCGGQGHTYEGCNETPKCVNCLGEHSSSDKNCPKWLYEKTVIKYTVEHHCSFSEARNKLSPFKPQSETMAAVIRAKVTKEAQTQTEIAIQASGVEIDAEVAKANNKATSTQNKSCELCPHCNANTSLTVYKKTDSHDTPKPYEPPKKQDNPRIKKKNNKPKKPTTVLPKEKSKQPDSVAENRYAALSHSEEEMEISPTSSIQPSSSVIANDPPDRSTLQEAVLPEHLEEEICCTEDDSSKQKKFLYNKITAPT